MLPIKSGTNEQNIYQRKSRWKTWLVLIGMVMTILSGGLSYYLAWHLQREEESKVRQWIMAYEQLNFGDPAQMGDITLLTQILSDNKTIPVILVNDKGGIDGANNFGEKNDLDTNYLRKQLNIIKLTGRLPIKIETGVNTVYIHYRHSKLLRLLKWFPWVQLLLIAGFIGVGYYLFSSARKAELNLVWIGMAKETAHQLGTPISALLAWIVHLRESHGQDENTMSIINELDKDIERLELIADRFSKIGSHADLIPENVYDVLHRCYDYMHRRVPRKVLLDFPDQDSMPLTVFINSHLFEWVVENLIRNAVDAMDGSGTISVIVLHEPGWINIEVSDTGKGIAPNAHKRVFEPGYSTRARGWGLGLSLARRIVESYHSGKIVVKKSIVGQGTTFLIQLPDQAPKPKKETPLMGK